MLKEKRPHWQIYDTQLPTPGSLISSFSPWKDRAFVITIKGDILL